MQNAGRRTPAPVIVGHGGPALAADIAVVVAATGRRLIVGGTEGSLSGDRSEVLPETLPETLPQRVVLLAGPDTVTGTVRELVSRGITVRAATVTDDPTVDGPGPVFVLPGQSPELAAFLGVADMPDCSVHGSVGGAGTSTFAAALAGALADPSLGGDGQSLLVDAGGQGRLDVLLGLEAEPGHRLSDLAGTDVLTAPMLRNLPWTGDVAVLSGPGRIPPLLDVGCPVVRDHGPYPGDPGNDVAGDRSPIVASGLIGRSVLVVPATVSGALAGREILGRMPGALLVLREMPRAELEWNDALTLVGRAPDVTWKDDPFLPGETDRGDFGPCGRAAGTAGTAAARLVRELW